MAAARDQNNNITEAWKLYETGVRYNERLTPNQYATVETNWEFFIGNQWLHLPQTPAMRNIPKPIFNILKRVTELFIASLTSSGVTLRMEPLAYYDGSGMADPDHNATEFANAMMDTLWEKFKMEYRVRDALLDAAVKGDYCAHFWFNPEARPYGSAWDEPYRGEIEFELVEGIDVLFGNPNDRRVENQPYILLVGRDTPENLQEEAERFKRNRSLYASGTPNRDRKEEFHVQADAETWHKTGVGGKVEIEDTGGGKQRGKATYVLMYSKVTREVEMKDAFGQPVRKEVTGADGMPVFETDGNGEPLLDEFGDPVPKMETVKTWETSVHVTKATRDTVIYEDVDTGLSLYPIAWGNWEKQTNQYHGRALITGLINNQIFINQMFATFMRHVQLMAFPKIVYNGDLLPVWNDTIGQAIAVHGLRPDMNLTQIAYTIPGADASGQILSLIDKTIEYTKDCLGATDVQMGNVKPDNTSAIMVLQTNSEVPLENIRSGLYEWAEDVGRILLDMMGTYYGERPVVVEREVEELLPGPSGSPRVDPMTGLMATQKVIRKVRDTFDFTQLKRLWFNLRIDAGATTYFSEIAMTQTLDNLRRDGTLDVIQYLERMPDKLIPRKQELIDALRTRIADGTQENAAAGAALPQPGSPLTGRGGGAGPAQGGTLDADKALQGLPPGMAARFATSPGISRKTQLAMGARRTGGR